MIYSSLCNVIVPSPHHSGVRNHAIDTVTIHCMAGDASVEACGHEFQKPRKMASSNYGVGSDGRIAGYVPEDYASWCSSNSANDQRAVTIEVACNARHPYKVTDKAVSALVDLLADICQRNGISKLLWQGDKSLIGQVDKQNMTVHRWFAEKACPGDYLYNLHGKIADEVNERLEEANMPRYNAINEMPDWAQPTINKLVEKRYLTGSGKKDAAGKPADLDLSMDMIRILVIQDRAGIFD